MKSIFFFLVLGSLLIIADSCAPIYVPSTINTPALREKGDAMGAVHLSNALELQGAYAVDSHFLVMGAFQSYKIDPTSINWSNGTITTTGGSRSNMFEFGGGYFNRFGKNENGLFEVLAGGGIGYSNTSDERYHGFVQKGFLQPGIGFAHKNIQAIFTLRPSLVRIDNKNHSENSGIKNPASQLFAEPAITLRAGADLVKFNLQMGIAIPKDNTFPYDYSPLRITAGMVFKFNLLSQNTTKSEQP